MVVDDVDAVETALGIRFHQGCAQGGNTLIGRLFSQLRKVLRGRETALFHRVGHLAADAENGDVRHAFPPVMLHRFERQADGVGVEAAAEGGIRGHGDDGHATLLLARGRVEGRYLPYRLFPLLPGGDFRLEVREDAVETLAVRAHVLHGHLRLPQLGGGDKFHRRSDLQRALDGADAAFYFL